MKSWPLVAFALISMACGSPVGPPAALDGNWTGEAGIFQFDASLRQDFARVSGTGAVGPVAGYRGAEFPTLATDVVGSYRHPSVELSWRPLGGGAPYSFAGRLVAPDRIEGNVTFGSANVAALTLQRQ